MRKRAPKPVSRVFPPLRQHSAALLIVAACIFAPLFLEPISSAQAQLKPTMPKVEGESLAGHPVTLPAASSGKVAVLIFGFSKASKTPTSLWAKKFYEDFGRRPDFVIYQLPVLEDVPRLVRRMVISSMKGGVPEDQRDHFVPILHGEADLKKLVTFKEPDDAYLVLLDRAGTIVQQSHGPFEATKYSQLRDQVQALLSNQK